MLQAKRFPQAPELVPLASLEAVAKSLRGTSAERTDYAVMACYNFLEGLVQECLDLIYENKLSILGSQRIPIEFAIGCAPGNIEFQKVFSHPKALAQCSDYLRPLSQGRAVPAASTAVGAKTVSESKSGLAIASKSALTEFGLEILGENIGNRRHEKVNFTDFYLVGTEDRPAMGADAEFLTMIAVTPRTDRLGLLAEILGQVAYHDLNIAKIHSRPALEEVASEVEPQMFYLEIMCHRDAARVPAVCGLLALQVHPAGTSAEVVRVLGTYPKPRL